MKIDGRKIAAEIYEELKNRVELKKIGVTPHLTVILVGEEQASLAYVNQKQKWGEFIGAKITILKYNSSATTLELEKKINELNNDPTNHAILIQRPLPPHIDIKKLELLVDPQKDIDGFHPDSPYTLPLPLAIIKILEEIYKKSTPSPLRACPRPDRERGQREVGSDTFAGASLQLALKRSESDYKSAPAKIPPTPFTKGGAEGEGFIPWLKNQNIVLLGKGATGGGPILKYLNKLDIYPALIDSKTQNPEKLITNADIIISAIGKPNIVTADKIKKGVILIGVGIFRGKDGKLHGDYDEENIAGMASFYTPTPGGVGPVNVAMLMENLIIATEKEVHLGGGRLK